MFCIFCGRWSLIFLARLLSTTLQSLTGKDDENQVMGVAALRRESARYCDLELELVVSLSITIGEGTFP